MMNVRNASWSAFVSAVFLVALAASPAEAHEGTPVPAGEQGAAPAEPETAVDDEASERLEAEIAAAKNEEEMVEAMVRESQNPLSKVISLPFQGNVNMGIGPDYQTGYLMNIQPVMPVTLSDKLLMINRLILPVMGNPSFYTGEDRQWGLGDANYTAWLSPNKPGKVLWGAGMSFVLPTGTEPSMTADKWAMGPSLVVVMMPGKWTMGGVFQNTWSVGGSGERDTNAFFSQVFANYNIGNGWYVGSLPIFTANWEADDPWTLQIGGTVGKGFRLGKQMIDCNIGYYKNFKRPATAPRSKVMFIFKLLWARK